MKQLFFAFAMFFSLSAMAQTTPSYLTIKLTKTTLGTVADSLAVINNGTVKHLPTSALKGVKQVTGTDGITVANGTTNPVIGISTISQLKVAGLVTDLGTKVDKATGKSLLSDSEIARLLGLFNYTHPTNHPPSIINQDPSNRFVTDAEKTNWNAKQNALGYTAENLVLKNAPNGYAGLGSDAKLLSSLLPDITISDTFVVSSQAAMLALFAQTGDVAVRTDLNKSFILKANSPTVLASWQELLSPTSEVTSVNGRTGAVVVNKTDVGLGNVDNTSDINKPISTATQTALNGKAPLTGAGTSGTWPINITGNALSASNSTQWNGQNFQFAGIGNIDTYIMGKGSDGTWRPSSANETRNFLGLGSNAYSSTAFAPLTGVGTSGTWPISISGNASSASNSTKWNNQNFEFAGIGSISEYIIGKGADGIWRPASVGEARIWLGLGSNAYTSTSFLPLSGGTLTGTLTATAFNGNLNGNATNLNGSVRGEGGLTTTIKYNSLDYYINSSDAPQPFFQALTIGNGSDYSKIGVGSNNELYFKFNAGGWKRVWHESNFNPANYLPLSGGTLTGNLTATGFFQSSDRRLKTVSKRDGDVAYFTWKDKRDTDTHIGYIAQEVKKEFPDQVKADEKGILSVNYIEVLVAKVQALEKRIAELEKSK